MIDFDRPRLRRGWSRIRAWKDRRLQFRLRTLFLLTFWVAVWAAAARLVFVADGSPPRWVADWLLTVSWMLFVMLPFAVVGWMFDRTWTGILLGLIAVGLSMSVLPGIQ